MQASLTGSGLHLLHQHSTITLHLSDLERVAIGFAQSQVTDDNHEIAYCRKFTIVRIH